MKQRNLFGFTLLILYFSCNSLVASQENEQLQLYWQKDITHTIAQNFSSCSTVASLKRTCKWLDQTLCYKDLPSHIIANEDYDMISDGLIATAHQKKQQDHQALLINNPQKRSEDFIKLKWKKPLSLQESINTYRGMPTELIPQNISQVMGLNNLSRKILASSVNPNIQDTYGNTPLLCACRDNYPTTVQLLLKNENIDPNIQGLTGETALYTACQYNRIEMVKLLISHPKTNPNIQESDDETALFIACENNQTKIVELLLAHRNINPNIPNEYNETALYIASKFGYIEIAKLLLFHKKTNPNIQDFCGYSALHAAFESGSIEIILLLLANKKIKPNIQNMHGYTALDYEWKLEEGNAKIIKKLYELGARHSWKYYAPHTIGMSIVTLLISFIVYRIICNNSINTITPLSA